MMKNAGRCSDLRPSSVARFAGTQCKDDGRAENRSKGAVTSRISHVPGPFFSTAEIFMSSPRPPMRRTRSRTPVREHRTSLRSSMKGSLIPIPNVPRGARHDVPCPEPYGLSASRAGMPALILSVTRSRRSSSWPVVASACTARRISISIVPARPVFASGKSMRAFGSSASCSYDLRILRPKAENLATPRQPVRHEVVTHVLGTFRYLCRRAGQNEDGGDGGI